MRRSIGGLAQHQHGPRFGAGFSLIEATIAIAIVGMMIVATSALLQRIPTNGREVRDQDLALKIARNELEELRASGYDSASTSPFAHEMLSSLASSTASVTVAEVSTTVRQVEVTVSWEGALGTRSLSLVTLIAKNSGLP